MADLNELVVFVGIAQHGSLSAASRALGMPISTVSRKLGELEARLGLSLIKRSTRKLSLSEAGLRLWQGCGPHLQALEEAEAKLTHARNELQGQLNVTVPIGLGRGEFIDFVSSFLRKHPGLNVDLSMTNEFVDLVTSPVDVAIRFGDLADASVIARRLGVSHRLLAASPSYLKERGTPTTPDALARHDCVLFQRRGRSAVWSLRAGKRYAEVSVNGRVSASNLEAVGELAIRGHGIACLPEPNVNAGVATGQLQRVLVPWTSDSIAVHAVYLDRKFVPAKVQAFLTELGRWKNSTWRKEPAGTTKL